MSQRRLTLDAFRYFECPDFADATILIRSEEIKAHRLILCLRSKYFKNCLAGQFTHADRGQEAKTSTVNLEEDDPHAVKGMVAYLHGVYFDTPEDFASTQYSLRAKLSTAEVAIYQANLHILGDKHDLLKLRERAQEIFKARIGSLLRDKDICKVASYVYLYCGGDTTVLRSELCEMLARHPDILSKTEGSLADTLMEIPELAADIVRVLANKNEELGQKLQDGIDEMAEMNHDLKWYERRDRR